MEQLGGKSKPLDNRPELFADLGSIFAAFMSLSDGRGAGGGFSAVPAPITFEAIDRWAQRFGPRGRAAFERFHRLIRALDAEFLRFYSARAKRKADENKSKGGGGKGSGWKPRPGTGRSRHG